MCGRVLCTPRMCTTVIGTVMISYPSVLLTLIELLLYVVHNNHDSALIMILHYHKSLHGHDFCIATPMSYLMCFSLRHPRFVSCGFSTIPIIISPFNFFNLHMYLSLLYFYMLCSMKII